MRGRNAVLSQGAGKGRWWLSHKTMSLCLQDHRHAGPRFMLQPCWVLAHLAAAHSIQHLPNLLHLLHALVKLELGSSNKSKPSKQVAHLCASPVLRAAWSWVGCEQNLAHVLQCIAPLECITLSQHRPATVLCPVTAYCSIPVLHPISVHLVSCTHASGGNKSRKGSKASQ